MTRAAARPASEPVVRTHAGALRGRTGDHGTFSFRGVPYAAAPVGARYLAPPEPPERWDGVRDAGRDGPAPPQPEIPGYPAPLGGDDYLNLNVFTPDPGSAGLPVFVWFCVGGFVICNNGWPTLNGAAFARDGVVAVTVNHRIGAEGFAIVDGAPDNRGALDWLAALEWVQEDIAAFGGDPGNVTIGGCSPGGAMCHDLVAMPPARGLFQRAIPLSGPPASGNRAAALDGNSRFASHAGMEMTRDAFSRTPAPDLVSATMSVADPSQPDPAAAMVRQHVGVHPDFIPELPWFRPVVDGELLPSDTIDVYRAGADPEVEMLLGHTRHEIDGSALDAFATGDQVRSALALTGLGEDGVSAYFSHLPDRGAGGVLGQAATDVLLRLWTARAAEARALHHPGLTYAYEFSLPPAAHGMDVAYLWDTVDAATGPRPPDAEMARAVAADLHACAVNFITKGSPGWPAYDGQDRLMRVFSARPDAGTRDPLAFEREVWGRARAL
jgi:para-nitrobenzyl esterase